MKVSDTTIFSLGSVRYPDYKLTGLSYFFNKVSLLLLILMHSDDDRLTSFLALFLVCLVSRLLTFV